MAELAFSRTDDRFACPTTGEPCPARENIVLSYSLAPEAEMRLASELDFDDPRHPRFDQVKMQARLFEHRAQALGRGCVGPEAQVCPVREAMSESPVRRSFVGSMRKVLNSLRRDNKEQ